jgi:hypothetical protein
MSLEIGAQVLVLLAPRVGEVGGRTEASII